MSKTKKKETTKQPSGKARDQSPGQPPAQRIWRDFITNPPEILHSYPWINRVLVDDIVKANDAASVLLGMAGERFDNDQLPVICAGLSVALGTLSVEVEKVFAKHQEQEADYYKCIERLYLERLCTQMVEANEAAEKGKGGEK